MNQIDQIHFNWNGHELRNALVITKDGKVTDAYLLKHELHKVIREFIEKNESLAERVW